MFSGTKPLSFLILGIITYHVNAEIAPCRVDYTEYNGTRTNHIYCSQFLHLDEKEIPLSQKVESGQELGLHFVFCDGKIGTNSFPNLREVTWLSISSCTLEELVFPELPQLTYLVIDQSTLPKITAETFKNLKNLKKLIIASNRVDIEEGSFKDLESLEFLNLYEQNSTLNQNSLKGLKNLKELGIFKAGVTKIEHNSFEETPELKKLSLDDNPINTIENGAFSELKQLEELYIETTDLKTFDLELLKELKKLNTLGIPARAAKDVDLTKLYQYCPNLFTIKFLANDNDCPELKRLKEQIIVKKLKLSLKFDGRPDIKSC